MRIKIGAHMTVRLSLALMVYLHTLWHTQESTTTALVLHATMIIFNIIFHLALIHLAQRAKNTGTIARNAAGDQAGMVSTCRCAPREAKNRRAWRDYNFSLICWTNGRAPDSFMQLVNCLEAAWTNY